MAINYPREHSGDSTDRANFSMTKINDCFISLLENFKGQSVVIHTLQHLSCKCLAHMDKTNMD